MGPLTDDFYEFQRKADRAEFWLTMASLALFVTVCIVVMCQHG